MDSLLDALSMSSGARNRIVKRARTLVSEARGMSDEQGTLDAFLQEFGLSNREGVALMCLAEALLRVPDADTADKLIAEKISSGEWADHKGRSDSLFVNASTWALMLTGQVIDLDREAKENFGGWFGKLIARTGEPVIRAAVMQAICNGVTVISCPMLMLATLPGGHPWVVFGKNPSFSWPGKAPVSSPR